MSQEATVQTLFCSQCGRTLSHSDLVQIAGNWVCAECKPAFLSRIMAGGAAASPLGWRFGGFWIRFGARFIDGLVFTIPAAVLFAVLFVPSFMRGQGQAPGNAPNAAFLSAGFITFVLVFFLAGACYEILMLKYRSATLGKMACGLKVIRPDGRSLSWGVCIGRFFMWNVVTSGIPYLNSIFLLATAIIVAVDDEKRALHDRVCDTRVIYKPSVA
jgi:uncharacterized RDD family membrane protein YckC/DNA-directed RNA polymerase subunit RPC12/RpoP